MKAAAMLLVVVLSGCATEPPPRTAWDAVNERLAQCRTLYGPQSPDPAAWRLNECSLVAVGLRPGEARAVVDGDPRAADRALERMRVERQDEEATYRGIVERRQYDDMIRELHRHRVRPPLP